MATPEDLAANAEFIRRADDFVEVRELAYLRTATRALRQFGGFSAWCRASWLESFGAAPRTAPARASVTSPTERRPTAV